MVSAMVSKATAAAAAQTVQLPGGASAAVLIAGMARQLLDLDRQVKDTTRLITERFRTCPQAAIIESLPGMGPVLGAEFLVATGGNLAAFATSGRLAAYAGLVPVPQDSGRVTGNLRRPQRYNRRLHHVFYVAAFFQHQIRQTVPDLLPAQAQRTADPHPSPARSGPPPGRRPVGIAARWPPLHPGTTPLSCPGGLTGSFRFVLATLRALHLDSDPPRQEPAPIGRAGGDGMAFGDGSQRTAMA